MKHNFKITILILAMFVVTQFIGLYVVNYYSPIKVVDNIQQNVTSPNQLPYGLEPPPVPQETDFWTTYFPSILFAFVIAIVLFFVLTKFKAEIILKGWFFIVIIIALSVTMVSFFPSPTLTFILISLGVAVPLAILKIFKQNFVIHNVTELFIYPGIAAVFVALLSSPENPNRGVYAIIALLILISIYDIWAVWHSGVMQKMAKYQIDKLKIFSGFFVPYISKKMRANIKEMKKSGEKKKMKVNIAILGGGDVIFPIIAAGIVLRKFGFLNILGLNVPLASIMVTIGATLGLSYLLFFGQKKKFYPAMPFISAGIFLALGLCYLVF